MSEPKDDQVAPEEALSSSRYAAAGVDTGRAEEALAGLLRHIPLSTRPDGAFQPLLSGKDFGSYANVLPITDTVGIALCTDGVGSKLLIAEQMGKFDTVGIDCIAMNVNDLVCVGAEPIALVDYLATRTANPRLQEQIGVGLGEGARRANIYIAGGETAILPEMIQGTSKEDAFDLVGTAVGVVGLDRILVGKDIRDGDAVIGLPSSGLHSNGYTLARKVLLGDGGLALEQHVAELGRTLGEELLEPTEIYVGAAMALMREGLGVRAFLHITGDGLLNLSRVEAAVGFDLDDLPSAPAIFQLVQETGDVPVAEMHEVFNMGVGLCAVVSDQDADEALRLLQKFYPDARVIGRARSDPQRAVRVLKYGIVGKGKRFRQE